MRSVIRLHDTVRLHTDLPAEGLTKGATGAVVEVFETPTRAYEVEFTDDEGRTVAQVALPADALERVH